MAEVFKLHSFTIGEKKITAM